MSIKKLVKFALNKPLGLFGYEVTQMKGAMPDVALYQRLYPAASVTGRKFYNIGAGRFAHPCWTNIDYESDYYAENRSQANRQGINYDLFSIKPLPISSGEAEVVYTSHTVEHITDRAAQNMFNESFRILKRSGIFRVTTPNIDLEYEAVHARSL